MISSIIHVPFKTFAFSALEAGQLVKRLKSRSVLGGVLRLSGVNGVLPHKSAISGALSFLNACVVQFLLSGFDVNARQRATVLSLIVGTLLSGGHIA